MSNIDVEERLEVNALMKFNLTHDVCLKFGSSLKFYSKRLLKVTVC